MLKGNDFNSDSNDFEIESNGGDMDFSTLSQK
jgi:hypothetical protein